MNVAVVSGRLSSAPRTTELGSGDVVIRYEVTVRCEGSPTDSVPVTWTGPAGKAQAMAALEAGAEVVVVGRVRRRWYRPASGSSRSTTEVVAASVVPAGRRAAARKALDAAVAAMQEAGSP